MIPARKNSPHRMFLYFLKLAHPGSYSKLLLTELTRNPCMFNGGPKHQFPKKAALDQPHRRVSSERHPGRPPRTKALQRERQTNNRDNCPGDGSIGGVHWLAHTSQDVSQDHSHAERNRRG